jgi:rusticyanin
MGRFGLGNGSMMGGSGSGSMIGRSGHGWMMGHSGYSWMMGGASAPGWMTGSSLPGFMMGSSTDQGQVMGRLFADAPGPRVSPAQATTLGSQVPAGASVDWAANRITFSSTSIDFAVVASPAGSPDETFRIAGLINPTIVLPPGAHLSIQVVNADPDAAHGLVVTTSGAEQSWMPMMTNPPAFRGAALWFLGNPTAAGMHTGRLSLTAGGSGSYVYLCPIPGHAQKGMVGQLVVS